MLISILGNLGSGKTLLCVMDSYFSDLPIVTNFSLKFENREIQQFDLHKFLKAEYSNCIILLDEAYNYIESRISSAEINRVMSYILFQSRKKNVTIYLTAQIFSSIDLRFRQLSDLVIYAQRINFDFCYFITDKHKTKKITIPFENALRFFNMYDTNEVIFNRDEKLDFSLKDGNEKEDQISEFANRIIKHYENEKSITANMVKLYFTTHDLPKFLSNDVFTYIKLQGNSENQEVEIIEKKSKKSSKKSVKKSVKKSTKTNKS